MHQPACVFLFVALRVENEGKKTFATYTQVITDLDKGRESSSGQSICTPKLCSLFVHSHPVPVSIVLGGLE
jgi:hypothetical protein